MPIPTRSPLSIYYEHIRFTRCSESHRCGYADMRYMHPGPESPSNEVAMCNRAKVPISELRVCPIGHWWPEDNREDFLLADRARFDRNIYLIETAIWRIYGMITNLELLMISSGQKGPPARPPEPDKATIGAFVEVQLCVDPHKYIPSPEPGERDQWAAVPGDRDACYRAIILHEATLPVLYSKLQAERASRAEDEAALSESERELINSHPPRRRLK